MKKQFLILAAIFVFGSIGSANAYHSHSSYGVPYTSYGEVRYDVSPNYNHVYTYHDRSSSRNHRYGNHYYNDGCDNCDRTYYTTSQNTGKYATYDYVVPSCANGCERVETGVIYSKSRSSQGRRFRAPSEYDVDCDPHYNQSTHYRSNNLDRYKSYYNSGYGRNTVYGCTNCR